jgi:hypothetical protein
MRSYQVKQLVGNFKAKYVNQVHALLMLVLIAPSYCCGSFKQANMRPFPSHAREQNLRGTLSLVEDHTFDGASLVLR